MHIKYYVLYPRFFLDLMYAYSFRLSLAMELCIHEGFILDLNHVFIIIETCSCGKLCILKEELDNQKVDCLFINQVSQF